MGYSFKFTKRALRELVHLPASDQKRISQKLNFFISQKNIWLYAKPLVNLPPSTHRFRVGKLYRLSFHIADIAIIIDRIELRGRAYRR